MKLLKLFVMCSLLAGAALATDIAPPKAPRPAPELAIALPDGKMKLLSSYRGKVVCVELLFTTCPHCQAAARLISKLQDEYGPKGFQALGAGFDPDAKTNAPGFVQSNHVTFPIGYLTREAATSFLGITPETRLSVPQIVFVDKKGVIRQQSLPLYDEKAATEENLRNMIETLLKEPGGAAKKPVATSVKKKAS